MDTKKISIKSFLSTFIVLLLLMIGTFVLANTVKSGKFLLDANGEYITNPDGSLILQDIDGGINFWKWLGSPVLALFADGGLTIIAIIVYLLIIGAVIEILNATGFLEHLLKKICLKCGKKRKLFLFVITLAFMLMGTLIGIFEEAIPLVPFIVGLAVALNYDKKTGIIISFLATTCGFAVSVLNPFSVVIAQKIAAIPLYSGIWMRILSFVLVYALLMGFILFITRKDEPKEANFELEEKPVLDRSILVAGIILASCFTVILSSLFIKVLQDYTIYISAACFLAIGITVAAMNKVKFIDALKMSGKGILGFLPAIVLILMAASIKYTLTEANVLDTILNSLMNMFEGQNKYVSVLLIYFVIILFEFFVPSSSAKAFLIIPIMIPLATRLGISGQICVLAYIFGDGFSNAIFPTNAGLLLTLNLNDVSYGSWIKKTIVFDLLLLVLTCGLLLFSTAIGY